MSSQRQDEPPRLKRPDEIDEVFGRGKPNPDRIGCPPHDVLVALARRERPIGDPAYDHLSECSPCYLEVRALKEAADLQRGRVSHGQQRQQVRPGNRFRRLVVAEPRNQR